jgi:hypothetical protein
MSEPTFNPDRMYRPREVVSIGHVPRELVYHALHAGDLKCLRRGPRFLVPGWCVSEWLRRVAA